MQVANGIFKKKDFLQSLIVVELDPAVKVIVHNNINSRSSAFRSKIV